MKKITSTLSLLLSIVISITPLFAQTQIGGDILGEGSIDHCGQSVSFSSDGNRVIIGSPFNIGSSYGSGHARVFDLIGNVWTQVGADIDGQGELDHFGTSVDISSDGNRIAIGAPDNDGNGNHAGHTRIYQLEGGNWVQVGQDLEGAQVDDESGTSVSISADGNRVAIAAPYHDPNGLDDAGQVVVYELQGNSWVQLGMDINGQNTGDEIGHSICLSSDGNRLAIGAPLESNFEGFVRVFDLIANTWTLSATISSGSSSYNSIFGASVSFSESGNRLAISANFASGLSDGSVEVYEFSAINSNWVQVGLNFSEEGVDDVSFSADGNIVAVAVNDIFGGTGIVQIFQYEAGGWAQVGADIAGEVEDEGFATSISLSGDGSRLAVGIPGFTDISYYNQGKVKLYALPLCGATTATDVITSCDPYTWIDGNTYSSSNNTATYTLINTAGCDSIVTLDLNIPIIDVSITNNSPTLMANATGATYQWLDCDNANEEIIGETSQTFVASSNGNFAVRISIDGCSATSDCVIVNTVNVDENNFANAISIFPNPTTGKFELQAIYVAKTKIIDQLGRTLLERNNTETTFDISDLPTGFYFMQIYYDDMMTTKRLVKE